MNDPAPGPARRPRAPRPRPGHPRVQGLILIVGVVLLLVVLAMLSTFSGGG